MKKSNILHIIILLMLLGLGFFLRSYNLYNVPAGFFADEASIGYNAFTILTKGTDEFGAPYPVFFKAFGEYKSPIQTYSTVPFVALFGLNELAIRMTSASYGLLSIIAIYLLSKELFKHEKRVQALSLISVLLLATSPWHIHFSRVSLEGLMAFVFFTTLGLYFFLKAQTSPRFLYLAVVSLTLAMYSYFPARIFIPLFGIGLFATYIKFFLAHKRQTILGFILLVLLLTPFIHNLFSPVGLSRWKQVNIFSNPPKNQTVAQQISSNYFRHFSVDFLFLKGDIDMPGQFILRHSVKGIGELYFFQMPLIVFGLIFIFKKRKKAFFTLLIWLILYPIGSMLTVDESPQATRSIIGVVPFQILSTAGMAYFLAALIKVKKSMVILSIGIFSTIAIYSFLNFISLYFISYPNYSSGYWGWQHGPSKIVRYFTKQENEYDEEFMIPEFNAPNIFFQFYAPNGCSKCRVGTPHESYNPQLRQLFAVTPTYLISHPEINFLILETIYYPDNTIAFVIGKIN